MLSEVAWGHCPACNRTQFVECPDHVTRPDGNHEHYCHCSSCHLDFSLDDNGHTKRDRELDRAYDAEEIDTRTWEREVQRNNDRPYPVIFAQFVDK